MSRGRSSLATGIAILAIALSSLAVAPSAQTRPLKRDAEAFNRKVAAIVDLGAHPPKQLHRTLITERELNAYFAYDVAQSLPAGVVGPGVTIVGDGHLAGRATVDLDAVRKASNATSVLDPRSYLRGQVPLTVTGVLTTRNGMGRFVLETAEVGGVPIPKLLLQEILGYYSRTPEHPQGITLDAPFELTAHIREIRVERGQAIIVQ